MQIRTSPSGPLLSGVAGQILRCVGGTEWEPGTPGLARAVAVRDVTPWSITVGDAPEIIASAQLSVGANSRIVVLGMAAGLGGVDAARFMLGAGGSAGLGLSGQLASESIAAAQYRTCTFVGVSSELAAGDYTVDLVLSISGAAGATIASASETSLVLLELPFQGL